MTRGKRIGVIAAVALAVGAGHYGWFSIFGPPARWGTGVQDVEAKFAAAGSVSPYAIGDSVRGDSLANSITVEERYTSGLPGRVVRVDDRVAIVERRSSWWPHEKNYGRFLLSSVRPQLRAEYGVYSVDLGSGSVRYLFPGHSVVLAPNRQFAAYMGSENGFSGFHTIRLWKIGSGESKPLLSLYEVDPGSGSSFSYQWSPDSKGLFVGGSTGGFSRSSSRGGDFQFVYSLEQDSFFDLSNKTRE
jgi:hypothetical protein